MLVGQEKLKEHFSEMLQMDTVPKLCIFTGEKGQGKYTFAKQTSEYIGDIYEPESLKVKDIRMMVEDSQSLSRKRVYILRDADDMTVQAQNALLKFAEEPTRNAYIMLTVEHENNILPTIKSRGSIYQMEPYTKDDLMRITDDLHLLGMYNNPGQIIRAQKVDIKKLEEVSDRVVNNIGKVSAANVFNIKNHFEEFDLDLVISMLLHKYFKKLSDGKDNMKTLEQIRVIYKYKRQFGNKSINKQNALEMLFVELREKAI